MGSARLHTLSEQCYVCLPDAKAACGVSVRTGVAPVQSFCPTAVLLYLSEVSCEGGNAVVPDLCGVPSNSAHMAPFIPRAMFLEEGHVNIVTLSPIVDEYK